MNQVTSLQLHQSNNVVASQDQFSPKQIEILKNSICRGVSDEEFEVFLMACKKSGLDPFMKQIYAVKRRSKKPDGSWGETMTIQTGIDGYRVIAERTGAYCPGPEPTYTYTEAGNIASATSYIKKQTRDGTWHTISASAYYDEYCQKTREGQPMGLWNSMPRTMLAKCAEAIALRKAFPAEMSGVYTKEEMQQAEMQTVETEFVRISPDKATELAHILSECDDKYQRLAVDYMRKQYKTDIVYDLPADSYDRIKMGAIKNKKQVLLDAPVLSMSDQQIAEAQ